jgi:hypothetical protein
MVMDYSAYIIAAFGVWAFVLIMLAARSFLTLKRNQKVLEELREGMNSDES